MKKLSVLILILSLTLSSCLKDNLVESPSLTLRLTDAPAAYDEVNVDIIGVQAIIDGKAMDLEVNAGIYNLLDFTNGKDTVLVDQQIPEGKLSQIRLILGENNTVIVDGKSVDLTTPSAQQSGLKLNVQASFLQGVAYEYVIDFDASRSIVKTGNGKYILKPVIKVFTKAVSGAIQGVVSPAKAKPLIYAISAQLDSVSTFADTTSGKFMFTGLSEGIYKLRVLPVTPYQDSTLSNISVKTGLVTKLDTLKL